MIDLKPRRVFNFETQLNVPIPTDPRITFEKTPLITPERLLSNWRTILAPAIWPAWLRRVDLIHTDPDDAEERMFPEDAQFLVGKSNLLLCRTATLELSLAVELSRAGISIETNSNHSLNEKIYAKVSFPDAPEDFMPLRRVMWGAVAGEITLPLWKEHDYGSDNSYTKPHGKPQKDARAVTIQHAERLVEARKAAGTLPKGFDVGAYISNIITLFTIIDALLSPVNADLDGSFAAYMAKYRS